MPGEKMSRKYFTVFKGDTAYDADKHKIYSGENNASPSTPTKTQK
jgi:hypothetical protein